MNIKIGQAGFGFVGGALHESFKKRGVETVIYDKYKEIGALEDLLDCDIIFLCLPTPYIASHGFDISALTDTIKELDKLGYQKHVVIKSTVEPGITQRIADKYRDLIISHNPEFLTARTALEDFDNQSHIVIGYTSNEKYGSFNRDNVKDKIGNFYSSLYPDAKISFCTSEESESMKLFANNFYAMKVQIFNEFYYLCQKTGADFHKVKEMMLENGWINPMHTDVPGHDGMPSYGGACFPKDTNALCHLMKTLGSPHKVLEATIEERNDMREDKWK